MTYVGIDNGSSGTIAILSDRLIHFGKVPTKKEFSYTKKKQKVTRIDTKELKWLVQSKIEDEEVKVIIERPLVNPGMFKATVSGVRALEAVLIVVEELGYPVSYIDSKEWQKELLPGSKGKQLKKDSLLVGNELFPEIQDFKHPDRDGLLIAVYSKQKDAKK
jgi:hypothetical protein